MEALSRQHRLFKDRVFDEPGLEIDLEALMNPELDIGVPGGRELLAFSDAVLGADKDHLDQERLDLADALGPQAVSAAAWVNGQKFERNNDELIQKS